MKHPLLRKISLTTALVCLVTTFLSAQDQVVITEFLASNKATLADEDGDYSDWVELHNAGEAVVNLEGWFLTDKADELMQWELPAVMLPAGGYLVVFASDKDRRDPSAALHTNFKLSASGEFLGLVKPDGVTIAHAYAPEFPNQEEDISYGLYEGQLVYFDQPTPGSENGPGGLVQVPQFSHTRGFYEDAFQLALSGAAEGDQIYYTTDGTRPTAQTGTLYTAPVRIETTTPFSAVATNAAGQSSAVVTQTYLFLDAILQQPQNPTGYPAEWSPLKFGSGNAPADYEMDPEVVNAAPYADLFDEALTSIPTLSIVTNVGYLFSHQNNADTGGIYIYTGNSGAGNAGEDWERPASIEYFDPNTQQEFQVNCGLRLHGGNSRVPENSQKHSFRVSFRSQYGPSKLHYPLFEEPTATTEFNALVLRAGYNYSWTKNSATQRENAQYLQDPFAKVTQRALGHMAPHDKFVHLYLNGLYWGLYNISEKLTNDFMETYLNGEEDDFDVIKDHSQIQDGEWTAWSHLLDQAKKGFATNENYQKVQGKNPDGTPNPALENLLDVENLIDYMQFNMYIGNEDWDHNNWYAARNRLSNDVGFRFYSWDAETAMTDVAYNNVDENNEDNPSGLFRRLLENEEFRLLFADHLQRNFFGDGPLTPEAAAARYRALADEIDLAIVAESARWGDYRKDVHPSDGDRFLYTRNEHWLPRQEELLADYFPQRTAVVVQQFKDAGLFPDIEAPAFSHEGGSQAQAIALEMSTNYGDIYYTTDGSDPRQQITSAVSAGAHQYTGAVAVASAVTIKARAKSGETWSPLTESTYDFPTGITAADAARLASGSFPNPFSGTTTFYFTLPQRAPVRIDIYTLDGRKVDTVQAGVRSSGYNEVHWQPTQAGRGLFLYRIQTPEQVFVGKVVRE
ncbi:Por secretion system C-terminal sorting domain-containing protein [Catalinimonas alkaloidigena]|uniref:Por secretion system C-terminal sorting domain-containing protein n=1 Tax=Catalinimonas alkaloidigena TaxID=1075417 RepID=A0A1G9TLI1_9BACT|nr:chitobiase/beta-hexosaminidase C-terminal domain-containing protein [Catalinimonas alkaloidigena]SDM48689.1 Por secretion system C-terminal sorting domain-containing protein [Catalinimonas alkaloidigena]